MTTEIQLRQSQWFYDDTGYYSYVLLNASEDQLKDIQQVLMNNGLRVLRSGRSYRPASNSVQYQWYIRISDETGEHPSRQRVASIFAPFVPVEVLPKELKELTDRVATQEKELGKLRTALSEKERLYQVEVQQTESLRRQNQELQAIYKKTQTEIQEYRQKIQHLELRLSEIQETALKPEDVAQLRDYQEKIESLTQELKKKESELSRWIETFEPEVKMREQKIAELERQLRDLQNKNAELEEEKKKFQEERTIREVEVERGNPEYLFREMLSLLLSNIMFLRGSVDILWREIQDPIDVLRDLTNLDKLKAKRVRGTKKWLEKHIECDLRLYYRQYEDSKYQVLISYKSTQEKDIDWLRCQ